MNCDAAGLLINDIQSCPSCTRSLNLEHVARDIFGELRNQAIVYLYCESCDRGWEILLVKEHGRWRRDIVLAHGSHAPEELALFKRHMEEASTVAA